MDALTTLYQRFTSLGQKFDVAVAEGKHDEALNIKKEMEKAAELIKAAREAKGLFDNLPQGGVSIQLPGEGSGTMPADNGEGNEKEDPALNMYLEGQYGPVSAEVKEILTELYGKDYPRRLIAHRQAFRRFLVGGEQALTPEERGLLKQLVLTPEQVRQEILAGKDIRALKSTMVEGVDHLGGYIVPADFKTQFIKRLTGMTVIRGRARAWTTQRDRVEFPVITGGDDQYTGAVRVTWVDEETTESEHTTNATFGLKAIDVHTVMASIPVSQNLLEDAAFSVDSLVATLFAEASAIDEDNQFIKGNGVGKPEGILPGGVNSLGLTEANTGNASALTWNGLLDLIFAVPAQYRQNAVFIMNRATANAIAKITDASNRNLWLPFAYQGGDKPLPRTLLGFPVLEQEIMPDVAANAYPIIFGDLTGYYIVDRIGMGIKRATDATSDMKNIVYFVLRRRLGGRVMEPWRFAVQKVAA